MLAWVLGLWGLSRVGEPARAHALVRYADEISGGDREHRIWIDASRELVAVRPWHPWYREARAELEGIDAARRARATTPH